MLHGEASGPMPMRDDQQIKEKILKNVDEQAGQIESESDPQRTAAFIDYIVGRNEVYAQVGAVKKQSEDEVRQQYFSWLALERQAESYIPELRGAKEVAQESFTREFSDYDKGIQVDDVCITMPDARAFSILSGEKYNSNVLGVNVPLLGYVVLNLGALERYKNSVLQKGGSPELASNIQLFHLSKTITHEYLHCVSTDIPPFEGSDMVLKMGVSVMPEVGKSLEIPNLGINEVVTDYLAIMSISGNKTLAEKCQQQINHFRSESPYYVIGARIAKIVGPERLKKAYFEHKPEIIRDALDKADGKNKSKNIGRYDKVNALLTDYQNMMLGNKSYPEGENTRLLAQIKSLLG